MSKDYSIKWYPTKEGKYGKQVERFNCIKIEKPTNDVGIDAKMALNKFIKAFGGLNKNTIVAIQEWGYAEDGTPYPIGEPIVPTENSIIPASK